MVKGFTFALIEVQNETLLPVWWEQPLTVFSSAQLLLHQQLPASQLWCQMGQQPCCISFCWVLCGSGSWAHWKWDSSWRDLRELIAWPHKFTIEQLSILLNPCLNIVFVRKRKLTSIIVYTVLTNDVPVSVVHLFGYTENTITIWLYCGEFLFLHLWLYQPDLRAPRVYWVSPGLAC